MRKTLVFVFLFILIFFSFACENKPQSYTLFFDTNGGEIIQPIKVDKDHMINPPEPVKENEVFMGWFWDSQLTKEISPPFFITEDTVIYASWETPSNNPPPKNNLTISFIVDGCDDVEIDLDFDSVLQSEDFPTPEREGFHLLWFENPSFTQPINLQKIYNKDTSIYGKWQPLFNLSSNKIISLTEYAKGFSEITVPDVIDNVAITQIDRNGFRKSPNLSSLNLNNNIDYIGQRAFYGSNSLLQINVPEDNQNFISIDGVLYTADKKTLIAFPKAKSLTSYELDQNTQNILNDAFGNCKNIQEIVLPSNLKFIDMQSFTDCTADIVFSQGIEEVSDNAFSGYQGENIVLSNITSIGNSAFRNCQNLQSLTIPSTVTQIGQRAFSQATYPILFADNSQLEHIGNYAFANFEYHTLTLPQSVKSIGNYAFYLSSLTQIELSQSVEIIGNFAFQSCIYLTEITIPEGVESIGKMTFQYCTGLQTINLPNSIKEIGEKAFFKCQALILIELKENIQTIGKNAFYDCPSLDKIYIYSNTPPQVEALNVFSDQTSIYVKNLISYLEDDMFCQLESQIVEID